MARIVKIQDSDYKLSVNSGGTITLNTGNQIGTVFVTGDLVVEGNTTSIQTANVEIEDKIILLNRGETGAGVSPTNTGESGIQIARGSRPDAFLVFDESKNWLDTQTGSLRSGLFIAKNANDELIGLQTNSITTDGYDLNLLGTGTAVVNLIGVFTVGRLGNVTTQTENFINVTGVTAVGVVGTVEIVESTVVILTGVKTVGVVGTVSVNVDALVNLTGVRTVVKLGTVNVWGDVNTFQDSIWTDVDTEQPSNWVDVDTEQVSNWQDVIAA
jgi:hypothetical protein